jgi:hypothetical protein
MGVSQSNITSVMTGNSQSGIIIVADGWKREHFG